MGLKEKANVIGAMAACAIFINVIFVFIARLLKKPTLEHWLGLALMIQAIPLVYLLFVAPSLGRPAIYWIQIGLMLAYLVVECLLDYILKFDFRKVLWMVIAYAMLFFSGTGGMIGVASHAGRAWMFPAIALYLVMAALAFIARSVTGM